MSEIEHQFQSNDISQVEKGAIKVLAQDSQVNLQIETTVPGHLFGKVQEEVKEFAISVTDQVNQDQMSHTQQQTPVESDWKRHSEDQKLKPSVSNHSLQESFQPDMWTQHSQSVASFAPSESRVIADALKALQTQLQEALDDNERLSSLAKGMKKRHGTKLKAVKLENTALKSSK